MPTSKPHFSITVDEDIFKEIEDFRFNNRYNSRSNAVLALIKIALDKIKKDKNS